MTCYSFCLLPWWDTWQSNLGKKKNNWGSHFGVQPTRKRRYGEKWVQLWWPEHEADGQAASAVRDEKQGAGGGERLVISSLSSFYSVQEPSPWDYAVYSHGGSSHLRQTSANTLTDTLRWKSPRWFQIAPTCQSTITSGFTVSSPL